MSPDPFIQAPGYTQSYNRYSYVWNNPMKFVDPDGELVWFVPVIVGALIGGYSGYKIGKANGATGWKMAGYIFGGAAIGGVAGYAGFTVGANIAAASLAGGSSAMGSSVAAGMMGGMISGGINGAGFTALSGGSAVDIIGNMIHGAVVGSFSGAAGAAAFQGMNNLLNYTFKTSIGRGTLEIQPFKWLPTNTLSYMAGSTASQMTANTLNSRNPFDGVDYGLNLGLLFPLTMDVLRYSNQYNLNIAKRNHPETEILNVRSQTELNQNGDLYLKQKIRIQEYFSDFKMEIGDIDFTGIPRVPITIDYNHLWIPDYKWQIFSLINNLSIRTK